MILLQKEKPLGTSATEALKVVAIIPLNLANACKGVINKKKII